MIQPLAIWCHNITYGYISKIIKYRDLTEILIHTHAQPPKPTTTITTGTITTLFTITERYKHWVEIYTISLQTCQPQILGLGLHDLISPFIHTHNWLCFFRELQQIAFYLFWNKHFTDINSIYMCVTISIICTSNIFALQNMKFLSVMSWIKNVL